MDQPSARNLSHRLFDLDPDGGDRIGVDHLVDFPAASDYHEVEIHFRIRGRVEHSCSSAIRGVAR